MYVFGVDLPIMELLFLCGVFLVLFGILLIITLFVIWREIRKLKELVLTEEAKISRFQEKGTQTKEKRLKELDRFIKEGIDKGFSKNEIKSLLIKKKWPKDIVESAIKKVG